MQKYGKDEAGNIFEIDAAGNPIRHVSSAAAPSQGGSIFSLPEDPSKPLERQIQTLRIKKMLREAAKAQAEEDAGKVPTDVTGADFLTKLPRADAIQVKALAEGRMQFPGGMALSKPYWQQKLAEVAQYDPTFDQVDYHSRSRTRADFTSGKSSQNIKALNTAIGHLGHLAEQIDGTASHGGFPLATTVNAIQNAYNRGAGDPGITNFEQTAGALAGELTAVYRGAGGAEADIKRYIDQLSGNGSRAQKWGAVQNIAQLLKSRLDAIGDQYTKGMGSAQAPLQVLDPGAKTAFDAMMAGKPPSSGGGASGGGPGGPPPVIGGPQGGTWRDMPNRQPQTEAATGAVRSEFDPIVAKATENLIRSGRSPDEVNAYLRSVGHVEVKPEIIRANQEYLKAHPGYGNFVQATKEIPTTAMERLSASPLAATSVGALNAMTLGSADEIAGAGAYLTGGGYTKTRDLVNARKGAIDMAHPGYALAGDIAGSLLPFAAPEMLLGKGVGIAAKTGADAGIGAIRGAFENNDNRLGGAVGGGLAAAGGSLAGRAVAIPLSAAARSEPAWNTINVMRRVAGKDPLPPLASMSPAETAVAAAANKAGPDEITSSLQEAQQLGVPMSLADTHPELRSLAGAAVRRSPTASQVAETALLPRARGQIDRFGRAVNRDLGPVGNVPQISEDLGQQARAQAGPLYDQAYAAPGTSSPKIDELLATPFGKQALSRARTIAANERRDPTKLGFDLNDQGEVTLTRVPSVQTLDYVKRGMDDVLEQYRNPVTNRLHLDEAGRAQNGVKSELLAEMDRLNPAYRDARAAYAGPVQSRDALQFGQDAVNMDPNTLGVALNGRTPEQLSQTQLGFRSGLMDQANKVRYSTNPWNVTLGTPAAEQRLSIMHPDNPGVDRMLRQRDLEAQMASTNNDVLGNSKTTQRQIADQSFGSNDLPQMALDAGLNLATGQVPIGLIAKKGTGDGVRRLWDATLGKRAVAKADEMAPMLLDTDPQASLAKVQDLFANAEAIRKAVLASRQAAAQWTAPLGASGSLQFALPSR